jgi:hypothetical protein
MFYIAHRHSRALYDASEAAYKRITEVRDSTSPAYKQASDETERAYSRTACIRVITKALGNAMKAHFADLYAQSAKDMAIHESSPASQGGRLSTATEYRADMSC